MHHHCINSLRSKSSRIPTPPIQCRFNPKVWLNLPNVYKDKVNKVIASLDQGASFLTLGGKKIKCNDQFVRFRIGRNYRLLLKTKSSCRELVLLKRESYENFFRRRR